MVVGDAALVWPALGLSVAWFIVRRAGLLSLDTLVLGCSACGVIALFGAPLGVAALGGVTNALQAPIAAGLVRRWVPGLAGLSGASGVSGPDSPRALARFSAAVLVAVGLGAGVAVTGLALLGHEVSVVLGLLLVGRNLCGGLVLGVLTLAVVAPVLERRRPRLGGLGQGLELSAAMLVGLGLLWFDAAHVGAPVSFLVLGAAVWAGARSSVAASAGFSAVLGSAVVVATLAGEGTFSGSTSQLASLLSQMFVVTVFGISLSLSTSRLESRRLQSELHETARVAAYRAVFLDQTMASVHDGIVVIDADGSVAFANPAAARILALEEDTAPETQLPVFDQFVVAGAEVAPEHRPWSRALRGEDVAETEAWVSEQPAQVLSIAARPLRGEGSRTGQAVVTFSDVTAEQAQRTALETFAGVIAHDLRNPLGAIDGWVELLGEHLEETAGSDRRAPDLLARVRVSSSRMSGLISKLLDHATVKDKQLSLVEVSLSEVVTRVVAERSCTAQVTCTALPAVLADATLVEQVVDNLIGNALKFARPGSSPRITVTGGLDVETGLVTTELTDDGVGVPAGRHEEIFTEFRRAHSATHDGHGLGLAICRRIVARHGGTITAHDRPDGPGTTVRFMLPAAATAQQRPQLSSAQIIAPAW